MKTIRDNRWDKAFQGLHFEEAKEEVDDGRTEVSHHEGVHDLKATIVMEHLVQASDVAHTMQHWDIYIKWNER